MKIFLVAGEASGDALGAGLMGALKSLRPDVTFEGVGGAAMTRAGLKSLFPLTDIAVMGFVPVVMNLPMLLRRIRQTIEAALAAAPDVLVIIDSPDFTHRVAAAVRTRRPNLPVVDYVSPTIWAWRSGRARKMRAYVDHVLALLPFEPAAHARLGGPPCTYVGHPLIERLADLRRAPDAAPCATSEPPVLLILPGSRRSELRRLMRDFGGALAAIAAQTPVRAILPTFPHLAGEVAQHLSAWSVPPRVVTSEIEKFAAFRRARAALAASGTVTLELALAGVPISVAYKVAPVEWLARHVVDVPSIVLPNLILGENVIPEFLQEACTPARLAASVLPLLADTPVRAAQMAAFARLDGLMRLPPGETPSLRAAQIVLTTQVLSRKGASAPVNR